MVATFEFQVAADQARNAYRNVTAQLGLLALDTAIPEASGAVAEKTAGQTREAMTALTLNSSFDLATSLAGARNLAEIVELQAAYWRKQFSALTAQAEEVPALSTKVVADAGEPLKGHLMNHG